MPDKQYNFKVTKQESSKGDRLLRKIFSFLPFVTLEEEKEASESLAARVHWKMREDGSHLVAQVQDLKSSLVTELKDAGDTELLQLFESVVDPVIQEFTNLEKRLSDAQPMQDRYVEMYNSWVDKAKLWTAITVKPYNREMLIQILFDHMTSTSDLLIRRDVKTLQEYATHELHQLGISEMTLSAVAAMVDKEVTPHIEALLGLIEVKPLELTLENLNEWKRVLNETRAKHYNDAFHVIDTVIHSVMPPSMEIPEDVTGEFEV